MKNILNKYTEMMSFRANARNLKVCENSKIIKIDQVLKDFSLRSK